MSTARSRTKREPVRKPVHSHPFKRMHAVRACPCAAVHASRALCSLLVVIVPLPACLLARLTTLLPCHPRAPHAPPCWHAGTEQQREFCEAYNALCAGHSPAYTDCVNQVAAMPQSASLVASDRGAGDRQVIAVGSGYCKSYVRLADTATPQKCMDQARARKDCNKREVSWDPFRKDSRGRAQCLCDAGGGC